MRLIAPTLAALVAAAFLGLLAAGPAAAAPRSCGTVQIFGTPAEIVALKGVRCTTAKGVARRLHRSGGPGRGWRCALAHAPFDRLGGRDVAFSCGKGGRGGNLRAWPHAFVGTIAPGGGGGNTPT